MTNQSKIVLGVVSFCPLVYVFAVFALLIFLYPLHPVRFWVIHVLAVVFIVVLIMYYIVNVFRNAGISKRGKIAWTIALVLASTVAMPVYWYTYLRSQPPSSASSSQS